MATDLLLALGFLVVAAGAVVPVVRNVRGIRRRRPPAAVVVAPFEFGRRMSPVPGARRSVPVDVAGLPGLVSVDPFMSTSRFPNSRWAAAVQARTAEPAGRVHVKVPLGPRWPQISVLSRGAGLTAGTSLLRRRGTDGPEIRTGDPEFDRRFRIATGCPDPQVVLAVVNPRVREVAMRRHIVRWLTGKGMWLTVGYHRPRDEQATVDWAVGLATLIVTSSGLPVVLPGPPPTGPAGQVPA